uniref:Uncharacterized protein n=1 Tax=Romanomermis culicivorax TaxID=13658 RepID=A0A915IVP7_ROMCU
MKFTKKSAKFPKPLASPLLFDEKGSTAAVPDAQCSCRSFENGSLTTGDVAADVVYHLLILLIQKNHFE